MFTMRTIARSRALRMATAAGFLAVAFPAHSPAFAQQQAAADPSPAQIAAAKDLVVASGIVRTFSIFVPQISDQITQTLTKTRPELADDLEAVMKILVPEFQGHQSEIIDTTARIYASRMSEQELKDTAAFFNTPSGKKYVDTQPAILDEVVSSIQDWSQKLSTDMMSRVRVEMKKKGRDL
jgi:hypothetical protein